MKRKAQKLLSLLLALVMAAGLLSTAVYAAPITFTDVAKGKWYYKDVQKAVDTGLINGYTDNTFKPDKNMTYAEAIKLAAVMHKLATTGSNEFEKSSPWYKTYADYAKSVGVISKDYDWNAPATRAGYMEIFAKAIPDNASKSGIKALSEINTIADNSIPDVSMSHPQAASIYKLYRAGILEGSDKQHSCNPDSNIKRSEVAAILTRMMNAGDRLSFSLGDASELKITTQPKDVTVVENGTATFTVAVSGGKAPYKYQWQCKTYAYDGPTGSNSPTLIVDQVMKIYDGDQYWCVITDADGKTVTSNKATLTVKADAALSITTQPKDAAVNVGGNATFTVDASGGKAPYTYEWRKIRPDGVEIDIFGDHYSGKNSATLTVRNSNMNADNGAKYFCVVTDASGNKATSEKATLTVKEAASNLTITTQPKDATVNVGGNATFTVDASGGKAPYTYEWRKIRPDGVEIDIFGDHYSGKNSATLTVRNSNMNADNGAKYFCVVTDASGNKATSEKATLTVKEAASSVVTKTAVFYATVGTAVKTDYKFSLWNIPNGSVYKDSSVTTLGDYGLGIGFDNSKATLTGTPTKAGTAFARLVVTSGSTTYHFDLTVEIKKA